MRAKSVSIIRKIVVSLVGFPLLALGLILIPLPGPGLVICFLAFLVLSIEFSWTRKYLARFRLELKKIIEQAKERQAKFKA